MNFNFILRSLVTFPLLSMFLSSYPAKAGGGNKNGVIITKTSEIKQPNGRKQWNIKKRLDDKGNSFVKEPRSFQRAPLPPKSIRTFNILDIHQPPLLKPLCADEYRNIMNRANRGEEIAQEEVVTRYFWGMIPFLERKHIQDNKWATFIKVKEGRTEEIDFDLYANFIIFVYPDKIHIPHNKDELNEEYTVFWKTFLSRKNNPLVQFTIGKARMYSPFENHKREGMAWLTHAANNGFTLAENILDEVHIKGNPIPHNYIDAVCFFYSMSRYTYAQARYKNESKIERQRAEKIQFDSAASLKAKLSQIEEIDSDEEMLNEFVKLGCTVSVLCPFTGKLIKDDDDEI